MSSYRRVYYSVGSDGSKQPGASSGVRVEYGYREGKVYIEGWYDSFVGIETVAMTLGDFLRGLHITLDDCRRALAEVPE